MRFEVSSVEASSIIGLGFLRKDKECCEMDFSETTRIVFSRIQKIEPELVSKIIGYILLKDHGDREMIRLACGPESAIHSLINEAKSALPVFGLSPKPAVSAPIQAIPDMPLYLQFTSCSPNRSRPFPSPATFRVPASYWDPQVALDQQPAIQNIDFLPPPYCDSTGEENRLHNQGQLLNLEEQLDPMIPMGHNFPSNYYHQEGAIGGGLTLRTSWRSPSPPEFPVKACHYYYKGYCKHGTNCRYYHGQSVPDSFSHIFSPNSNELINDEHVFSPGSLKKLEVELTELLKSKRGQPISIAMLPMIYYEKYGKVLQAEGYLTESQRHGKAGYSLTKLLARLKNTIRILDRPHGQHSVILVEDIARHMEFRNERNDPGAVVAGSQQIYLTFPAESTFTEEDVSNYFNQFGAVRDVRIPCQMKRMFGFVSFEYPETVKSILSKGNPHYVCGARVLVKPYKEKTRVVDRKYTEKIEPQLCYSQYLEIDPELHSIPRFCNNSRLLRNQLIEEHEQTFELQRRHLSELQLAPQPHTPEPSWGYSIGEMDFPEGCAEPNQFPSTGHISNRPDILNNVSTSNDKARHASNNCGDQDGLGFCLPDSPFASSSVTKSISAVV